MTVVVASFHTWVTSPSCHTPRTLLIITPKKKKKHSLALGDKLDDVNQHHQLERRIRYQKGHKDLELSLNLSLRLLRPIQEGSKEG